MVINLTDVSNTILLCFFFHFYLMIELYFLVHTGIAKIFNPTSELAISIGIATKAEVETYPAIPET